MSGCEELVDDDVGGGEEDPHGGPRREHREHDQAEPWVAIHMILNSKFEFSKPKILVYLS